MRIRAANITAIFLAAGAGASTEVPPTQAVGSLGAVKQAFQALVKQGATSEGSSVSFLSRDITSVGDSNSSIPFVETLPTLGGLMVKTRLPVTGQPERPQKDVAEVALLIKDACVAGGGVMERRDSPWGFKPTKTPVVARGFKALMNEGVTGQLWCSEPSGVPLFMVEVTPSSEASSPPFSIGWNWNIAFQLVSPSALEKHGVRRLDYEKSVANLRSGLKVGTQVQVQTKDLPEALTGAWIERHRDLVGNMCGMVIDVRGSIAQVQIQATQLAVEIQHVFPQAKAVALTDVLSADLRQPQTWCIK
jgi:hypothetical protein